jgi:DNA topoisomerase-3
MLREGRELIPTAKAFQLMTLLRGLQVEELSKPELTGDWEYKLAQMEHGKLSRDSLHARNCRHDRAHRQEGQGIRPRHRARRLRHAATPCPNCGGVVKENYRRYACTGAGNGTERRLRLLVRQIAGRPHL